MLTRVLQLLSLSTLTMSKRMMNWNQEAIPYATALRIGWNLPHDVVGAEGVYGGIVKRKEVGGICCTIILNTREKNKCGF